MGMKLDKELEVLFSLGMSVRAHNCLHYILNAVNFKDDWHGYGRLREGVKVPVDVISFLAVMKNNDNDTLLRLPNFGKKSLYECRQLEYRLRTLSGEKLDEPSKRYAGRHQRTSGLPLKTPCGGLNHIGGSCGSFATITIRGIHYCRTHAGDIAIDLLLSEEEASSHKSKGKVENG